MEYFLVNGEKYVLAPVLVQHWAHEGNVDCLGYSPFKPGGILVHHRHFWLVMVIHVVAHW